MSSSAPPAQKRRRYTQPSPLPDASPMRPCALLVLRADERAPSVFLPTEAQREELRDIGMRNRDKFMAAWTAWLHTVFPGVATFSLIDTGGMHVDLNPGRVRLFMTIVQNLAEDKRMMPTNYPCLFLEK